MGEGPYEKREVLSKENEGRVFFFKSRPAWINTSFLGLAFKYRLSNTGFQIHIHVFH